MALETFREKERQGADERKRGVDNRYETEADVAIRQLCVKCPMFWSWGEQDKSEEASLGRLNKTVVTFHPLWSNGTAGVRASQPVVNCGINYWEIEVGDRLFGTSQMFGVSKRKARLHSDHFINLLGEDENSWGLSHRGWIHHGGQSSMYCHPFTEYKPVTVGVLLDMEKGELTYFKNGKSLGVAFTGLQKIEDDLYPTVCSTAAKSIMTIGRTLRSFTDLQDRCRHVVASTILPVSCESSDKFLGNINTLPVPNKIKTYISSLHKSDTTCSQMNRLK